MFITLKINKFRKVGFFMRKNFGSKPWSYPQPVFIVTTYDENGVPDAMNAAWGGISENNEISLCIGDNHKTTQNLLAKTKNNKNVLKLCKL